MKTSFFVALISLIAFVQAAPTPNTENSLGGIPHAEASGTATGQGSIANRAIISREGGGDPCGDDSCNPGDDARRRRGIAVQLSRREGGGDPCGDDSCNPGDDARRRRGTTEGGLIPHGQASGIASGEGSIANRGRVYRREGGGDPCGDDSCNPGDDARRRRGVEPQLSRREGGGDPCGDDSCNPGDDARRRGVTEGGLLPHGQASGNASGQGSIANRAQLNRREGGGDPCGDDSCNQGDDARRRRGEHTSGKGPVLWKRE